MGVSYKLTDDVIEFAKTQKLANQKLSCQDIANAIKERYQINVSKSSIHQVLKEAGIIVPKAKKLSNPAIIPLDKKEQIQQLLTKAAQDLVPIVKQDPPEVESAVIKPVVIQQEPAATIVPSATGDELKLSNEALNLLNQMAQDPLDLSEPEEILHQKEPPRLTTGLSEVFLQGAAFELGDQGKEPSGDAQEAFLTAKARAYKLTLTDDSVFFIDPYFTFISQDFELEKHHFYPRRLWRMTMLAIDRFVVSHKPLIMNVLEENSTVAMFRQKIHNHIAIKHLEIINETGQEVGHYDGGKVKDFNVNICNEIIYVNIDNLLGQTALVEMAEGLFFDHEVKLAQLIDIQGFKEEYDENIVITLIIPMDYEKYDIIKQGVDRFNFLGVEDAKSRRMMIKIINEKPLDLRG